MPVPSTISDLSTTPSLNSPAGSESPALVDDYLRTLAAFIKQVNDASVQTAGDQTIAGTKTFSSPIAGSITGNAATATSVGNLSGGAAGNIPMQSAAGTTVMYSGQLAGMRNKIINGGMKVDQRNAGASQTFTAGAALAYCVDRWYGYCTGANISGQQVTLANGQKRYRFTGAASNTAVGFGQRIEAANCLELADSTATLSVKLSSSSLTSITWTAYYATTADAFGTLASPTRTQIATGTFTINSTEATYSTNISIPAAAITGIEIVFTGGTLLGSQTLTIGDVQLEPGSVATAFEHRPIGLELALCQRYYAKLSTRYMAGQYLVSTEVTAQYVPWPEEMRATPTVTHGALSIRTDNGSFTSTTLAASAQITSTGIDYVVNRSSASTTSSYVVYAENVTADAEI